MIGGTIVQAANYGGWLWLEVLCEKSLDRCARVVAIGADAREGDQIWWMDLNGYVSRPGVRDQHIGRCRPAGLIRHKEFA